MLQKSHLAEASLVIGFGGREWKWRERHTEGL